MTLRRLMLGSAFSVFATGGAMAQAATVADLTAPGSPHHSWFGEIEGSVRVLNLPEIGLLTNDVTNGPVFLSEPDVLMGGGSLRLGHVFGQQLDPQIWGGRLHVSAGGYYFTGSDDESFASDGSESAFIDFFNGGFVPLVQPFDADVTTDYTTWGGDLRAGLDFDMGGGFRLTPSIVAFGGRNELEQTVRIEEQVGSPLPHFFDTLQQTVDTSRFGGGLGLGATYDFGNGLQLRGGAQIAVTYNNTTANAYECAGSPVFSGGCNGALFEGTTTVRESAVGYVASGGIGISYDLGFATIGLAAEMAYDSYQPVVDWPNQFGQSGGFASGSAWSYGGSVFVTVPIN